MGFASWPHHNSGQEQGLLPGTHGFTSFTKAMNTLPSSNRSKWCDIRKARQCGVSAERQDEPLLYMANSALSAHCAGELLALPIRLRYRNFLCTSLQIGRMKRKHQLDQQLQSKAWDGKTQPVKDTRHLDSNGSQPSHSRAKDAAHCF